MAQSGPAIILFGHGSRDPAWRQPMEAVAARLSALAPARAVRCAYLELDRPDLAAAVLGLVLAGERAIRIVPMFLGAGRHVREDLPRLVEALRGAHTGIEIELRPPVGEDGRVLDLLAAISAGNP